MIFSRTKSEVYLRIPRTINEKRKSQNDGIYEIENTPVDIKQELKSTNTKESN